jgi:hypothetical protein
MNKESSYRFRVKAYSLSDNLMSIIKHYLIKLVNADDD